MEELDDYDDSRQALPNAWRLGSSFFKTKVGMCSTLLFGTGVTSYRLRVLGRDSPVSSPDKTLASRSQSQTKVVVARYELGTTDRASQSRKEPAGAIKAMSLQSN